jgi:hypothetical protein
MAIGDLISNVIHNLLSSTALALCLFFAVIDLVAGVARAISTSTFAWSLLSKWVADKMMGAFVPILLLYIVAAAVPDASVLGIPGLLGNAFVGAASLAAGTFIASEIASIGIKFKSPGVDQPVTDEKTGA